MLMARRPFDTAKASFQTHLNYIKRMDAYCNACEITTKKAGGSAKNTDAIKRFLKLHELTVLSIDKDVELSHQDPDFAVIIAPWFAVKCYYALYYQESILIHLVSGSLAGFGKGGHTGVRTQLGQLIESGNIIFSKPRMGERRTLTAIEALPSITPGQNTGGGFWRKAECTDSILKKLCEYKIHDGKVTEKWNLLTKKGRESKKRFMESKHIMLTDFFYWYRIKANYRDLDYIDFENGVTTSEVSEYVSTYHKAFSGYNSQLVANTKSLLL